ncbi:MAG: hypothetical protein C0483_09380 [Pirellula sp.]|nr:hypothetical protein [Pirellula sp.]
MAARVARCDDTSSTYNCRCSVESPSIAAILHRQHEYGTMNDQLSPPAGLAWSRINRWFLRGRVFRLAIQVRMLVLASVGVLLTIFGWWCLAKVFEKLDSPDVKALVKSYESCPWSTTGGGYAPISNPLQPKRSPELSGPELGAPPNDAVYDPWARLTAPALQLFNLSRTFSGAAFLALCLVWNAAVWALFGGALTRSAVVQLTREEPATLGAALGHAGRRWISYFSAPLLPLGAMFLVCCGLFVLGLVMRMSVLLAAVAWPLALLGGIVMALAATGVVVGWPLMHSTISAEGSDGFDAVSRSYSYVFQRPLHYLFYCVLALLLGLLGLTVVELFAGAVWQLSAWGVSWGSGQPLMEKTLAGGLGLSRFDASGAKLISFWFGCVKLVVLGYAFAYFWSAAAAIYLLLRYDADGVELDEVFRDEAEVAYGLPPLVPDPAGVPTVPANESTPGAP